MWEPRTVYQFTYIKSLKSCPKLASRCFYCPGQHPGTYSQGLGTRIQEKKDFHLFQVLSNMCHVHFDLVWP